MTKLNGFSLVLIFASSFGLPQKANAGCWVIWQGLKSQVECDARVATPDFFTLQRTVNQMANVSAECKGSVIRVASYNLHCGTAIVAGIKSGGATVWLGDGEACYTPSREVLESQRYCSGRVNIKNKPVTARVCNGRSERISVAMARRNAREQKVVTGWFWLKPSECRSFSFSTARVIYAMALAGDHSPLYPDYRSNDFDDNAIFCINRGDAHVDLNLETCLNRPEENPYDYFKSGSLKLTTFGRVSGLPNGYTFTQ